MIIQSNDPILPVYNQQLFPEAMLAFIEFDTLYNISNFNTFLYTGNITKQHMGHPEPPWALQS